MNEERKEELLKKLKIKEMTYEEILELLGMMNDEQWKKFVNRCIASIIEVSFKIDKLKR